MKPLVFQSPSLLFVVSLCLAGCQASPQRAPCADFDCSGHGVCVMASSGPGTVAVPTCLCDTSYSPTASGWLCLPDADTSLCAGTTCSGHGTCVSVAGQPACVCDAGYPASADGLSCVDACLGITCGAHGTCTRESGPRCSCVAGYQASLDGLSCEATDDATTLTYRLVLTSYPDYTLGRAALTINGDLTRAEETVSYNQNNDWWGGKHIGRRWHQRWTLDGSGEPTTVEIDDESEEGSVSRRRHGIAIVGTSGLSYTFQRLDQIATVSLPHVGAQPPVTMMGAFEYLTSTISCSSMLFYTRLLQRFQSGSGDPQVIEVFWPTSATLSRVRVSQEAASTASKPVLLLVDHAITVTYDDKGYPESVDMAQEGIRWERYDGAPADLNMDNLEPGATYTPDPLPVSGQESSLAITSTDGTSLAATLTLPTGSGPFPAVLMVTDPMAQDRDTPMYSMPQPLMQHLAAHLAAAGYASLRYDPRGRGQSGGDGTSTTATQLVQDAAAAHQVLATAIGVDASRLFVLSHGTGAITAISLLASSSKGGATRGYLALAPVIKELDQATLYHGTEHLKVAGLSTKFVQQFEKAISDRLKDLAAGTYAEPTYAGLPAGLWKEWLTFDGSSVLGAFAGPVLAVRGDQDLDFVDQLPAVQDAATAASKTNLSTQSLAGLGSLLSEGDTSSLLERTLLPLSLTTAALGPITNWLDANK